MSVSMRGPNSRSIPQNRSHIGEVSKGFDIGRALSKISLQKCTCRVSFIADGGNVFMPGQVTINGN